MTPALDKPTLSAAIARALTIDGWMEPDELRWLGETAATMQSVVEIGCWQGRSTSVLVAMCPGDVFAVDHWQGGKDEPEFIRECPRTTNLHSRFIENVGRAPNLITLCMASLKAALRVDSADMVFVDGGHGYEEVRADIRAWLPKTKRLICGHDFFDPRVRKAVYDELGNVESAVGSIWAKAIG